MVVVTERGGKTIFFVAVEGLSKELVLDLLNRWSRRDLRFTQTTSQSTPTR